MKVTRTLYVHHVADWRAWLRKHQKTARAGLLSHHPSFMSVHRDHAADDEPQDE